MYFQLLCNAEIKLKKYCIHFCDAHMQSCQEHNNNSSSKNEIIRKKHSFPFNYHCKWSVVVVSLDFLSESQVVVSNHLQRKTLATTDQKKKKNHKRPHRSGPLSYHNRKPTMFPLRCWYLCRPHFTCLQTYVNIFAFPAILFFSVVSHRKMLQK